MTFRSTEGRPRNDPRLSSFSRSAIAIFASDWKAAFDRRIVPSLSVNTMASPECWNRSSSASENGWLSLATIACGRRRHRISVSDTDRNSSASSHICLSPPFSITMTDFCPPLLRTVSSVSSRTRAEAGSILLWNERFTRSAGSRPSKRLAAELTSRIRPFSEDRITSASVPVSNRTRYRLST